MKKLSNNGFGYMPVIVVLVLVGLLLFAGIRVNNSRKEDSQASQVNVSENSDKKIMTTQDLESTTNELDSVNVDKDLETADLDNDISSVL